MGKKVVAMPAIPGGIERGGSARSDLEYTKFARLTWNWWCKQHCVEFVVLDQPLGDEQLPPTFQRWLAPARLMTEFGPTTCILLVDADTMIRWDAPDIFEIANGRFAAVRGSQARWIYSSLRAYQHLFPQTLIPWWEYFNAGIVVLNESHLPALDTFNRFCRNSWPTLRSIQLSGDYGSDQTPLNFIARQEGLAVHFLPAPFNLLHCFPGSLDLWAYERGGAAGGDSLLRQLFERPGVFDFVEIGYVWHFTNTVRSRRAVMEETWHRVSHRYPGAQCAG